MVKDRTATGLEIGLAVGNMVSITIKGEGDFITIIIETIGPTIELEVGSRNDYGKNDTYNNRTNYRRDNYRQKQGDQRYRNRSMSQDYDRSRQRFGNSNGQLKK